SYNVTVRNSGPASAQPTLEMPIPPGATLGQTSSSQGSSSVDNNTLVFSFGTLGSSQSATATVVLTPSIVGTLTPFFTVSGAFMDPRQDNDGVAPITTVIPPPQLSIAGVSVTEGNSGTTTAVFTVTLSPPATQTVTVHYATSDGTATAGSDYTATS